MKEIDLIRSEVLSLIELSKEEPDDSTRKKLTKSTINNFFDFLEEKFDERIAYLSKEF